MSDLPILEGVLEYLKKKNKLFCMPGHKGGKGFFYTSEGKKFLDNIIKCDMTEVEGLDNLQNPQGIIKQSGNLLSRLYGSKKSYFLVNGSTSGNLIMIFSSFNEGDKVIVERNCHKSIFNAIIMRKLKPVYIKNKINSTFNAPLSISKEHFLHVIRKNKDAKGIIVTYPNYYGICDDLPMIINEAKKYNMKVLVDSAHGAHFGITSNLPKSAVNLGADMVVTSAHKTLPSVTQTAFLHVNRGDFNKIEFYTKTFLSTSPSYIFLCSMDYSRFYLEKYGKEQYDKFIQMTNYYRKRINNLKFLHIIGKEDLINFKIDAWDIDLSRCVINVNKGYNSKLLCDYLKKNGIEIEMNDGFNIILIGSPFNEEKDFKRLYEILKNYKFNNFKQKYIDLKEYSMPIKKFHPYEVMEKNKKWIEIDKSKGFICGNNIIPYPPGIPIIMMGEVIDENIINFIKYNRKNNIDIIGIKENKIMVVDE